MSPFVLGITEPLSLLIFPLFLLDSNKISSSLSDSELTRLPSVASEKEVDQYYHIAFPLNLSIVIKNDKHKCKILLLTIKNKPFSTFLNIYLNPVVFKMACVLRR